MKSLNQVPALFNKNAAFGAVNIDIGGGRFNAATDYLRSIGTNMIFDPYNRAAEENEDTLSYLRSGKRADTATVANVLNVIAEPEARANVILQAAKSGAGAFGLPKNDFNPTFCRCGSCKQIRKAVRMTYGCHSSAPRKAGLSLRAKVKRFVLEGPGTSPGFLSQGGHVPVRYGQCGGQIAGRLRTVYCPGRPEIIAHSSCF